MDLKFILEIVGYISSVLVAISLMMSNVFKLRVINAIGALIMAIYGYFLAAYPVSVVNGWIFIVDLYFLFKMTASKDYFKLLEGVKNDSAYLNNFLNFYERDIFTFCPEFKREDVSDSSEIVFILRNLVPAGIFIFTKNFENRVVTVELDYTIPDYRDMKNTSFFIFDKNRAFKKEGYKFYRAKASAKSHSNYLKKLGFVQKDDFYEREI